MATKKSNSTKKVQKEVKTNNTKKEVKTTKNIQNTVQNAIKICVKNV